MLAAYSLMLTLMFSLSQYKDAHSYCQACLHVVILYNFVQVYNHGLHGGASPVLTVTGFVNGRAIFDPHRIHTSWLITKQFVASDYVDDPYGCARFGANPSTGGF